MKKSMGHPVSPPTKFWEWLFGGAGGAGSRS